MRASMPRIFDNLAPNSRLLPALQETLNVSTRADFCVGYFNLRGWRGLATHVDRWTNDAGPCRILIGMQKPPHDELLDEIGIADRPTGMDNGTANRLRLKMADKLRQQLTMGAPNNTDETTLRQLATQLRSGKVKVKLFLRHTLHAKLYLLYRNDPVNPIVGYLGSSNLTFSGLIKQGELNMDVLDHDATLKLKKWFEERWTDQFCIDITDELAKIIEESWARATLVPPYHIYLKMAYHLSNEARAGLNQFKIPKEFGNRLFAFQEAAVKIAARHLYKRGGVLIGDVVGLGKTLMATAVARVFEDDHDLETLIISPKNLVNMWEDYAGEYRLRAKVISLGKVLNELSDMRRYRLVIIDESHNLRNREGRKYQAIREYVRTNDSKCILLSATPYNKAYQDLSSQLRIFMDDDQYLGIRPERLLQELGDTGFSQQHQVSPRTLAAFDRSPYADDWRNLLSRYMVRRTRSFIKENYAETDPDTGQKFLRYQDGGKSFFPARVPKTIKFSISDSDQNDQYARLYSQKVVDVITKLKLPRYGLGNYMSKSISGSLTSKEQKQIQNLSRAGPQLMGFNRTNLFKRLESSGESFLLSVKRHLLRNYVFLHAICNGLDLPIGTQDAAILDTQFTDEDGDSVETNFSDPRKDTPKDNIEDCLTEDCLKSRATLIYKEYKQSYQNRFGWLRSDIFTDKLKCDLQKDAEKLLKILQDHGAWKPEQDAKLNALHQALTKTYPNQKILVFSQFADTVRYLEEQLGDRGMERVAGVTGDSNDPTEMAHRFSPISNKKRSMVTEDEIRVLIATDVMSEGQNLQDCHVVVNYDLPWAIIRLSQRAGRVDRIGQTAKEIFCLSFFPAEGIERIIDLRNRVCNRLKQNAKVVGTDETFFEDEIDKETIVNLYNEKADIDGDEDDEVDLTSHAYQIWKNAINADPKLEDTVMSLPDVVFSSRSHKPTKQNPEGVLVFVRTPNYNNALAYVDREGKSITESQLEILSAAKCDPDTLGQSHHKNHHSLVKSGVKHIAQEEQRIGGQLGQRSGARYRVYTRLKAYADSIMGQHSNIAELRRALHDIYHYPLRSAAKDTLNRQLRMDVDDKDLAEMVIVMRNEDKLCLIEDQNVETQEPRIVCSLGLFSTQESE